MATDEKNERSDVTCLVLLLGTFGVVGAGLLALLFWTALAGR
jgi:hypothetical protein